MKPNNQAFTLIELLVVVLIIGILAAVAMPQYQKVVEKSKATQALVVLKALVQAQETYYLANGFYATSFNQLDIELTGWTGKEKWYRDALDTRSNGEWSLQIFRSSVEDTQGNAIYMGRISGPYTGSGFMYWFERSAGDHLLDTITCYERTFSGVIFSGEDGDYCKKIMGGTKYINGAHTYVLPY